LKSSRLEQKRVVIVVVLEATHAAGESATGTIAPLRQPYNSRRGAVKRAWLVHTGPTGTWAPEGDKPTGEL
jgi:hypothetical protein